MLPRAIARMLLLIGPALVLAGFALNPWLLERYVLLDGNLDHGRAVLAAEIALVLLGLLALGAGRRARSAPAELSARRATFIAVTLAGSLLLALGLGEVALRVLLGPERLLHGEALWEYRWRAAHVPGIGPRPTAHAFDRYDPELGWRPVTDFASPEVRTNAQGIRADHDVARARSAGRARVVTIGDSYTWGEEVANPETWPAQLEQLERATEVLNFGVHGYGIDQATLRLREEALAYAPDLVILGFIADDVERDVLAFRDFAKPRFALAGGALQLGNVPVPTPEQVLARPQALPLSYLAELAGFAAGDLLDRTRLHPYEARESWRVTAELLGEAERETRAAGARFVLAYFPTQLDSLPTPEERLAAAWALENGVDFVDLRGAFAALPEAEWRGLYRGVHWSPAGNQLVARLLRDAIEERRLLAPGTRAALP